MTMDVRRTSADAETTDDDADRILVAGREVLTEASACFDRAAAALGSDFVGAVHALSDPGSFTMVLGVGKSGYVGQKFAASLLSTGHGAAFVHPTDAMHGDLGIAEHSSLAVLLSHSGNTEELISVIPAIKQFGIRSALIVGSRACALADHVDWIIETGVHEEAGIGRLAPTTSSTTTLAVCDAMMMASLAVRGFSADQFRRYHPGGSLGWKLRKVRDLMSPVDQLPWLLPSASIYDVLEVISVGGRGYAVVCDAPRGSPVRLEQIGLITDGDIRRAARDRTAFPQATAAGIMTRNPRAIADDALAMEALRLMEERSITSLLCTDGNGLLSGAVHIHAILAKEIGVAPRT